jgi:hypothetical protein
MPETENRIETFGGNNLLSEDEFYSFISQGDVGNIPEESLHNKALWQSLRDRPDGLGAVYLVRYFLLLPPDIFTAQERREFWQNIDFIDRIRNYQNIPEGLFSDEEILKHWLDVYNFDPGEVESSFNKIPNIVLRKMEEMGLLSVKTEKLVRTDGRELFVDELIDETGHTFGTKDIRLATNRSGEFLSFASLISPDYKLISMDQDQQRIFESYNDHTAWSTDSRRKTILYGDLSLDGSLFALLHEAGHSFQQKSADIMEILLYQADRLKNKEEGELSKLLENYEMEWAKNERNAWAYALKKMRTIKRNLKINIEPKLASRDDLHAVIGTCLSEYDKGFEFQFGRKSSAFTGGKSKSSAEILKRIRDEEERYLDEAFAKIA